MNVDKRCDKNRRITFGSPYLVYLAKAESEGVTWWCVRRRVWRKNTKAGTGSRDGSARRADTRHDGVSESTWPYTRFQRSAGPELERARGGQVHSSVRMSGIR